MSTTDQPLTRKAFLSMTAEELKKLVHDPAKLAEANAVLSGEVEEIQAAPVVQDPPTDEATQAEAERVAAEEAAVKAEADKAAAKAALEAEYKAAGVTVHTDADGNITKIVMNYQAKDDAGNPIGRPTYLEAKSWFEMTTKQRAAHENAVRFAERVKKQKFTKKEDVPSVVQTLSEQELLQLQEDLKSEDRDKASKAAEQVRLNDERKKLVDADVAIENARQAKVSYDFLARHLNDFNRCEANVRLITDYMADNQLRWDSDNLEAAFTALESQFAPKEQPVQKAPDNPAPAAPVVATPPPVVATPPAPPAAPIQQPPASRPGVNAGLVPGQQSAPRPSSQAKGLTKADIKNMSRDEYKRRLRDPKFVAEVNAALAKK